MDKGQYKKMLWPCFRGSCDSQVPSAGWMHPDSRDRLCMSSNWLYDLEQEQDEKWHPFLVIPTLWQIIQDRMEQKTNLYFLSAQLWGLNIYPQIKNTILTYLNEVHRNKISNCFNQTRQRHAERHKKSCLIYLRYPLITQLHQMCNVHDLNCRLEGGPKMAPTLPMYNL